MRGGISVVSLFLLFTLISVLFCVPVEAQTYRIRYEHYLYATGGGAVPVQDQGTLNSTPELYTEIHFPGAVADNSATVRYFADIFRGSLGSYAFATGDVNDIWPYGFTATGRVEKIEFSIDLYFDVEAGTYPDGVEVSVSGVANGAISSTVAASAQVTYWVQFLGTLNRPLWHLGNDDAGVVTFNEPFTLSGEIVSPGTTLPSLQRYTVTLTASISNNQTGTVLYGTSPDYTTGTATVDVYSGLQFTDVTVPEGVTWTSPDDVFLGCTTGDEASGTPKAFELFQNVPNPFNPSTTIRFDLPDAGPVRLRIYDVKGALVATLLDGYVEEGTGEVVWTGKGSDGRSVASGIYFYRLTAGGFTETKKMVLLR